MSTQITRHSFNKCYAGNEQHQHSLHCFLASASRSKLASSDAELEWHVADEVQEDC